MYAYTCGVYRTRIDGKTSFLRGKLLFYFISLLKKKSEIIFSDIVCHFYLERGMTKDIFSVCHRELSVVYHRGYDTMFCVQHPGFINCPNTLIPD